MKKLVSLLLVAALLLGTVGCYDQPDGGTASTNPGQTTAPNVATTPTTESNAPTSAPTTQPTQPAVDEMQLYQDAIAALSASTDILVDVSIQEVLYVGGDQYKKAADQQITYLGLGTEDMKAQVSQTLRYDGYSSSIAETYVAGVAYATVYGSDFSSSMTAEEYAARYLPLVILDKTLYAGCSVEHLDGAYRYTFTDASGLEAWLDAPGRALTEATATAVVSASGAVTSFEYTATYTNLGASASYHVVMEFSKPTTTGIFAPADAEYYTQLAYLDGPMMLEEVYGYLSQVQTVSFASYELMLSQAASTSAQFNSSIDSWGAGAELLSELYYSYNITDHGMAQTYTYEQTERFENGKYTVSIDGGDPTDNRSITAALVTDYIVSTVSAEIYDCAYFVDAECTDLGNVLLIKFTGNDLMAETLEEYICEYLFGNAELLDDNCTASRLETVEYYIGIDKYMGLPTSIGLNMTAYHTIDGYEFMLQYQLDQSICLGSMSAYNAVTDQSAPDVEPENKATPVFYHVTGADGQELWLLGTIHVGDDRTGYLPQAIYDAFNASDALAVECNIRTIEEQMENDEALQQAIANEYYYADGTMTQDHIDDPEMYEIALDLMKATGNYFYNAPYLTVPMWTSSIGNFPLRQCYALSSDKGVDNRLLMLAEASGKPVLEVESYLFQLQMETGWSQALNMQLLAEALLTDTAEYYAGITEMYEMWCAGDETALREYLKDDTTGMTAEELKLYEEYHTAMNTDRDKNMILTAISYLESGETVFFAVGLAHVLGEGGLVDGLRAAGYTVELVIYE